MNPSAPEFIARIRQQVVPIGVTPFQGDLFETKPLAVKLTNTLKWLKDGGAIAIDSPWGSGKTWFAKNWKLDLEQAGCTAVYIDAFALDYVDDPFLMIAGELLTVARTVKPEMELGLLHAGAKLGKAFLPVGTKIATSMATKWLVGEQASAQIGETFDKAVDGLSGFAEKQVEKKLKEYEAEKTSAEGFRRILSELAATLKDPIVVFVDELDRCRPDFAVKTLERIKHFFEVPGVVFVLLVNGKQLAASVRGAYGPDIDAETYLRKFILFSVGLPKSRALEYSNQDIVYCKEILKVYGFPDRDAVTNFAEQFGALATALRLEYRDIERGCALFAIAQPAGNSASMLAWIIALKLWSPSHFERVMRGDKTAHVEISNFNPGLFGDSWVVPIALELHKVAASGFTQEMDGAAKQHLNHLMGTFRDMKRIFPWLCEKVNLAIR